MRKNRLLAFASVARHAGWGVALAVIAGASVTGCPGTLDNPSQFSEPIGDGSSGSGGTDGSGGSGGAVQCAIAAASVPDQLFREKCATSACHDASNPAGGLDMVTAGLEGRLLDQMSSQCPGKILVDTTNPANSLMYEKVSRVPDDCGERMPFGGELTPAEIACVRDWIDLITGNGGQTDAATDSAGNSD
jgi:hypothetical protein